MESGAAEEAARGLGAHHASGGAGWNVDVVVTRAHAEDDLEVREQGELLGAEGTAAEEHAAERGEQRGVDLLDVVRASVDHLVAAPWPVNGG